MHFVTLSSLTKHQQTIYNALLWRLGITWLIFYFIPNIFSLVFYLYNIRSYLITLCSLISYIAKNQKSSLEREKKLMEILNVVADLQKHQSFSFEAFLVLIDLNRTL